MKNAKNLKIKIRSKEITLGSWITIGNGSVAEIMANAGFDWLVIDLEHSFISIETAGELIRVIDLCGKSPLVRITSGDADQIKRVLDAGAHGIIVPSINTVCQAEAVVAATRYAPHGFRGVGLGRAQGYGASFNEYLEFQNNLGPLVIVMIEHIDALKDLVNILSVPGVDGFIIGPYDLSCSLGIPGELDRPEFLDVLNKIKAIGEEVGCPTGIHLVEPNEALLEKYVESGYNFIAYGVDMRMLDLASRLGVKKFHEVKK